jgi:hypothetical protein
MVLILVGGEYPGEKVFVELIIEVCQSSPGIDSTAGAYPGKIIPGEGLLSTKLALQGPGGSCFRYIT